jgi:hypothetical protein
VGHDLNANFVVWPAGAGVAEHVNHEVEVLIVGMEGVPQPPRRVVWSGDGVS